MDHLLAIGLLWLIMIRLNDSGVVAVSAESASMMSHAVTLAQRLALPLIAADEAGQYDFLLIVTPSRLKLRWIHESNMHPIFVDFMSSSLQHRRRQGGGRQQALAKAIGLKRNNNPTLLDATAGYGRDAFVLACLGCRVTMVEQSSIMGALLQDALTRMQLLQPDELCLNLIIANAREVLMSLLPNECPDVIYIDPMYPETKKTALVKKEMRLLRALVGGSQTDQLIEVSLQKAKQRVVVKRPDYAQTLAGLKPSMSIHSKKTRYDVYLC